MTRVIAVASGKGGVGKTTISANLGIALSIFGEDVLLLDMDINMANLELILGLHRKPVCLKDVLAGKETLYNAIYEGPGGVKIVPAGLSLANTQHFNVFRMEKVLEQLLEDRDFILLDTPAGLERNVLASLSLAQEVILVTTPEATAVSDTLKTKKVAQELGADLLGVIINSRSLNGEQMKPQEVESLLETPILSIISEDMELRKSFTTGKPFLVTHPTAEISQVFLKLAHNIRDNKRVQIKKRNIISRFINTILGNNILSNI